MGGRRWIAFVVAGVAALAFVGAALAATCVRWNGGLGRGYGNGVEIPVRVGESFSVGMTDLQPGERVRIEAVGLHGASRNVQLVGVLLYRPSASLGTDGHFPSRLTRAQRQDATGAVLRTGTRAQLVVGLRATAPGSFSLHGVDILYREHWHGLDLRRRAHVGMEVQGCAVAAPTGLPRCKLPHFSWESY